MAKGITLQELDSSALVNLVQHLGTTSNNGDAYSITTSVIIGVNQKFTIKFNATSSSAPTLKINNGTAFPIKKQNGNNSKVYASFYTLFWDGTNFTLLGEGGEYGTAGSGDVRSGKTIGTENGLVPGGLSVRATGPTTINPTLSGQTLQPGIYDGPITIKAGGRKAHGYLPDTKNDLLQVTGLEFNPKFVQIQFNIPDVYSQRFTAFINSSDIGESIYAGALMEPSSTTRISRTPEKHPYGDIVNNSFQLRYGQTATKKNIEWWAYE